MADLSALVVDFGGVLTTSLLESFQAFCEKEGVDPARMEALIRASYHEGDLESPVTLVETGRMSTEEFERHLAKALSEGLHQPVAAEGLVGRMLGGIRPDERMLEGVRRIRKEGIATALLSNSWDLRHYTDFRDGLFDVIVISGEVGLRKPDPEIYALTAERLALPPEACVFVDDHPGNVEAATTAGMTGVWHRDTEETLSRLEELFELRGFLTS
jgi:putative hydrolase of the HAD superfamily